jgi:hypothetical protein
VPTRPEGRRSDLALHGLPIQRHRANHEWRDRPLGNIWITNNWKIKVDPNVNPGGNAIVIAVGAAAPLKTPLIGPPSSFK